MRNQYDWDDRKYIYQKSEGRCAHCGKRIEFGGQATVDHFVPLNKGGINHKINIIMLCYDCNQEKKSKIYRPKDYIKYIKPEYMEEIENYFNSYIHSFEFVSRHHILACDEYLINVYTGPDLKNIKDKKKRAAIEKKMSMNFVLRRAQSEDMPELIDYFVDYLDKTNYLHSRERAIKNIEFWNQFGALYIIRDAKNEIRLMAPIVIARYSDGYPFVRMFLFSKYATTVGGALAYKLPIFLAQTLTEEQNLPKVDEMIMILDTDNLIKHLDTSMTARGNGWVMFFPQFAGSRDGYKKDGKAEEEFYGQFKDVERRMNWFFSRDGYEEIRDMGNYLIQGYCDPIYDDDEDETEEEVQYEEYEIDESEIQADIRPDIVTDEDEEALGIDDFDFVFDDEDETRPENVPAN